jgi:Flp pilus assembly protein protease CpaA
MGVVGRLMFLDAEHILVLKWLIVSAACSVAAVIDVRFRKIPNKLTIPLFFAGIGMWVLARGLDGLGESLWGIAIAGLPFFVLFVMGGGGAGDAKMMIALGAWLGIEHAFIVAIAVGIAGGLLSLGYAVAHGRLTIAVANTGWMVLTLPSVLLGHRSKSVPGSGDIRIKTPYSVAMLAGTCAAALWVWTCAR